MRLAVLVGLLASHPAMANDLGPWGEPHLAFTPRTPTEQTRIAATRNNQTDFSALWPYEDRPAGAATEMSPDATAPFSHPAATLPDQKGLDFRLGEAIFEKFWVQPPSATVSSDGLGPLFSARSCASCHVKDGRGHPPESADDKRPGFVMRVSVPGENGAIKPEPNYGLQIQSHAISGHPAEGQVQLTYRPLAISLGDGSTVELRAPEYALANNGYGALARNVQMSPRVAPQMIGLGLLEAIPEADILANADPQDADGDGITGRPNVVWSREFDQWMLGRFGHKAGNPTLRQQSADAANGDIGLSSTLFPDAWGDCQPAQANCTSERDGNTPSQNNRELGDIALDLLTLYVKNLAAPARLAPDAPNVLRGKETFYSVGCADCHVPSFVTHRLPDEPERSFQMIWPYSDMLLHDMGEGLADNRPEWQAHGREWRTAPLWGIGRTKDVNGRATFLHDGRARTLLEAILWHGGEAVSAKETVRLMPARDRADLISFLESL